MQDWAGIARFDIGLSDSLRRSSMSYGDPKKSSFNLVGSWSIGDAYWIVKLAFHPEMANLFKRTGGKHGAVKTTSGKN